MPAPFNWLAHSPGTFSRSSLPEPGGTQSALGAGQATAKSDAPRLRPHLFAGDAYRHHIGSELLRRIAARGFPNLPREIVVHHSAGGHRQVENAGGQISGSEGQVSRVAGQQPALPVRHALSRAGFVRLFGLAQDEQLGVPSVDQVRIRHERSKGFVTPLEPGILERNFSQRFRMRIENFHAFPARSGQRPGLRLFHRVQQRVQQVQRYDHDDGGVGVRPLQFPGDTRGVPRDLFGARLGVNAVGLHVTRKADMPDGVRVRVCVLQVRAETGFGIGEDDFGADLQSRANRLGERIGRLDWNVDGLCVARGLIGIEDNRHFRQARNGAHPGRPQGERQLQSHHLRTVAQNSGAGLDGEFQAARHDRKVGEAAALQATCID